VLKPYGLAVVVKTVKAPRVGTHRFAEGTSFTVPNAAPVAFVDERFTDGRYVLNVDVGADSLSAAAGTASKLARTLDHRLRLAEAGNLRGKPVKLAPGAPQGGPDLPTPALMTSGLGGPATAAGPGDRSGCRLSGQPAGVGYASSRSRRLAVSRASCVARRFRSECAIRSRISRTTIAPNQG
jgi:hypothetical protein